MGISVTKHMNSYANKFMDTQVVISSHFLFLDVEEKRKGNHKHTNLQEEFDSAYTKPQNKQLCILRLEVSFGFFRHSQQT